MPTHQGEHHRGGRKGREQGTGMPSGCHGCSWLFSWA